MKNGQKFEEMKDKMIADNEALYGKEAAEKYGRAAIDASNKKLAGMTEAQHRELAALSERVIESFLAAFKTKDPAGEKAAEAVALHKKWLMYYWTDFSKEAYMGLGNLYVEDSRFRAYYDKHAEGLAGFIRDSIKIYCFREIRKKSL